MGVNIFAINGFNDIQFNIQSSLPSTIIHCDDTNTPNINFDYSCPISSTSNPPYMQCINDTTTCNHPIISPSISPSTAPSISPTIKDETTINPTYSSIATTKLTTSTPTNNPSTNPITSNPSYQPSTSPTSEPTISPTVQLTISPTIEPTYLPTILPSDLPTYFPTILPSSDIPTLTTTQSNDITTSTRLSKDVYKNDTNVIIIKTITNNGDNDSIDHTKSIAINLTNLMYVIVGTVLVCCFICAICLLFNILSARFKLKNTKLHKWSLSSHFKTNKDITNNTNTNTNTNNDEYKLRRNSNSSSDIHSDIDIDIPPIHTQTQSQNCERDNTLSTTNCMNMAKSRSNVAGNTGIPLPQTSITLTVSPSRDGYQYYTHNSVQYQYHRYPNPLLPGIKEEDCDDAFSRSVTMPDVNKIYDPNEATTTNEDIYEGTMPTIDDHDSSREITVNIKCDSGDTPSTKLTRNRRHWIDNRAPRGKEQIVPMFSDKNSETMLSQEQIDDDMNEEFGLRLANCVNVDKLLSDQVIYDIKMENKL